MHIPLLQLQGKTHSINVPAISSPDISWIAVARPRRWACHLATAGCWFRGVPERYVAGADIRGHQERRPYPWSQQVIHEISGLIVVSTIHILPHLPILWRWLPPNHNGKVLGYQKDLSGRRVNRRERLWRGSSIL